MENSNQSNNQKSNNLLCPSYPVKPGAKLYGIVNSKGFIDYLQATIEIDETFVEEAAKGRDPDKRFRFAGNCAKNGCKHWEGQQSKCGLIGNIIELVDNPETAELKPCPIRSNCRWFHQRGGLACAQCNEMIRNLETVALEQEHSKMSVPEIS